MQMSELKLLVLRKVSKGRESNVASIMTTS